MTKIPFNPDDHVPLSVYMEVGAEAEFVRLRVRKELAEYVAGSGGGILAARWTDGAVALEAPASYDPETGEALVRSGGGGTVVLVSPLFRNEFPITTGWNSSLNEGRGGADESGADGIGELRIDPATGSVVSVLNIRDEDDDSPYLFATARLALLPDRPDGSAERTPGFGRYIGDAYSLHAVTEEAALKLSADCLEATGYPVLLRNAAASGGEPLLEGAPLFQLVNNERIASAEGAASLAAFLLPPGWRRSAPETGPLREAGTGVGANPSANPTAYPILFTGYYDQNENVYLHCGLPLLKAIGRAMEKTGQGVVGIVWNGGGSIGTRTQQPSAYSLLNSLFRTARERYHADSEAVVSVGGSRGGLTSLIAAANPIADGYKVRYALCYGVPLSLYGPEEELLNVSYPARWEALSSDMGLRFAWRPGWRDEEGHSAEQRYWRNTFGTSDEARIAERFHPGSARLLGALRRAGTRVWLNSSTHDPFTAFWPALEWVRRARGAGIPLRHEIGYRHGHNNSTDLYENASLCLEALAHGTEPTNEAESMGAAELMDGTKRTNGTELLNATKPMIAAEPMKEGTAHYRRTSEAAEEWRKTEEFVPASQPVFFEGPKLAVAGLPAALSVYGPKGGRYRLLIRPDGEDGRGASCGLGGLSELDGLGEMGGMDEEDAKSEEPLVLMEGAFPEAEGLEIGYAKRLWQVPAAFAGRTFRYELSYCADAETVAEAAVGGGGGEAMTEAGWTFVAPEGVPFPGADTPRRPTLKVLAEAPDFTGGQWLAETMSNFIGWGLSEA
ncbi:hypothetical protein [Cohnella fermenti]|uniref:Uncharacterized protein n=1 Tax=Cohnella fermenti TaxID=2565925 RepID=A0A4S4BMS9_9BACL|nr:hypothetical protein [Cohnella fermenti]THF73753.1 hypothetical protein E6C55_28080 [Cohnella fermenti]